MLTITSGSFSRLASFELCKFQAYLRYAMKVPEPERPLPAGKTEHANDRGTRIHTAAELYVNGQCADLTRELTSFKPEFEKLRALYKAGVVSLEGEWGLDQAWEPTKWDSAWLRMKLDALVMTSPETATVIDFKTGRKFGNEVKHASQGQLYQLGTFLRFPTLEQVTTEFWYTDQDDITTMTFRRDQGLRFKRVWAMRLEKMTSTVEFPPSPNIYNCKWCGYGPWGTGHCERGVQR